MRDIELAAPSRRNLLLVLGLGAAGAAVAASPLTRLGWVPEGSGKTLGWWERTFASLRHGGVGEWSALTGQTFQVASEQGPSLVKVAEVRPLASEGSRPRDVSRAQAFAVVFEASPGRMPAGERIYSFAHAAHDAVDIHVGAPVLVGQTAQVVAIFN